MSRAFVNDDASDARADEAPELKIPIPPGSRNYLTPEGAAALADELGRLETEERPRLSTELEKASRSGNADGLAALRSARARVDRRIEYLSRMAALAETVEAPANGYARVAFGARVLVLGQDGIERSYRIVGVDEADPEHGLLGWTSPVARALVGKRPGDKAVVRLPEKELTMTVLGLEPPAC